MVEYREQLQLTETLWWVNIPLYIYQLLVKKYSIPTQHICTYTCEWVKMQGIHQHNNTWDQTRGATTYNSLPSHQQIPELNFQYPLKIIRHTLFSDYKN
jgi:hypothetical protein